jgi:hypothetical protein
MFKQLLVRNWYATPGSLPLEPAGIVLGNSPQYIEDTLINKQTSFKCLLVELTILFSVH